MPMRRVVLPALLFVLATPLAAAAQVRHCVTPDGQQVFTDRECAAVGAVEQVQARPVAAATVQSRRGGCARNLDDLMFEMTGAFDARDANRLASVYHWAGMAGSAAYDVMARLDGLVQRPLLDIVPVLPDEPVAEAMPPYPAFEDAPPAPATSRAPVALRVEQTLANGITPLRTVFGLQKHFGCWWIKG